MYGNIHTTKIKLNMKKKTIVNTYYLLNRLHLKKIDERRRYLTEQDL